MQTPELPTNNLVTPLLTDLYQITMAYGYWKTNTHNQPACFEMFFRKNPFKGSFTVFCGVDEVLKFVSSYRFSEEDIRYLKTIPVLKECEEDFFTFLSELDCSEVEIKSMTQGSLVFPRVPLLTISGPLAITQLLETTILTLMNYPSLIATNAARMVIAARGQYGEKHVYGKVPKLAEFGLRRAQGPDGGVSASKYCMVGGFDAVANVIAGQLTGIPVIGTHAHSFVMSFMSLDEVKDVKVTVKGSTETKDLSQLVLKYREESGWTETNDGELAAFIAYGGAFPSSFLCLIDTYDTMESGIKNFILVSLALNECGYVSRGVRLDSGDLAELSIRCHEEFAKAAEKYNCDWLKACDVVASNDINEKTLHELNQKGHGITSFGIGTNLVTCQAQPALGCVYKLVEINGKPRIKLSNEIEKVLIPGKKRVFRLFDNAGNPLMDLLTRDDEPTPKPGQNLKCYEAFKTKDVSIMKPSRVEEILKTVWSDSKAVKIPSLIEARQICLDEIKSFDSDIFRLENPSTYEMRLSEKLHMDLHSLWESMRGDK